MALNLPLVSPYMDKAADFSSGVNFAVAGATALDRAALLQSGVMMPPASVPLTSQLDWFKSYLNATCDSPEGTYVRVTLTRSTNRSMMARIDQPSS
jgi:hypothetical protein